MSRLLLVEDDELVGTMVRINMASEGHEVVWIKNGSDGLDTASTDTFDLVLLDISLPGMNGIDILRQLRARNIGTPVLMLTARSDVDSKVSALDLGADDYLAKPFEVHELIARVNAVVRRSQARREVPASHLLHIGPWEVDLVSREARHGGQRHSLSEKEAEIVRVLAEAGGQPVSRAEVLDRVWGEDAFPTARTVDNFLSRLRKVFEPTPDEPRYILTVRGVGYRLVTGSADSR
jgi:DNA-binding response OmpR family regulator